VARLLAAQRPAAFAQRLEDVAVADLRRRHLDARIAHGDVEAVVGHDGHRDAAAGELPGPTQVQGGERDELVAVDDRPGAIDRQHAITVAVQREAERVAAVDDRPRERIDVGRAAALVDVAPVGSVVEGGHRGAEAAEDLGRDAIGRAVGAVQGDVEAGEVQVGEALVQRAQVVLLGPVQRAHAPDRRARRRWLLQARLDLRLDLVGELEAVGAKNLIPLSR
jgi:hypothetical protein